MARLIDELGKELVADHAHHVLVVGGNIHDLAECGQEFIQGVAAFLESATYEIYTNVVTYDGFYGIQIKRGDPDKIAKAMAETQVKEKPKDNKNNAISEAVAELNSASKESDSVEPFGALRALDRLLKSNKLKRTIVILNYANILLRQNTQGTLSASSVLTIPIKEWSHDESIHTAGHFIVLITRRIEDLDPCLLEKSGCVKIIRIPKPGLDERLNFLTKHMGLPVKHAEPLSRATSGLSLIEMRRIFKKEDAKKSVDELISRCLLGKKAVLSDEYGDVLEVMLPKLRFDAIGGLNKVKMKLKSISRSMRDGRVSLVPMGVAFMGPPGTGKTIMAEALAAEAEVNLVRPLDIKNMWVGESERRMTRFINALRDLAPVIVFIDEMDQDQGQRGAFDGDSGVTRNLFKKMLVVMSDKSLQGHVLWLFATNRPDLIDPAMKRSGRCDYRMAFLPPDTAMLAEICKSAFKQYPEMVSQITDWTPYAEKCEGYSGADMIEVVRRAWVKANEESRGNIAHEDMLFACSDYRPQHADNFANARMTLLALDSVADYSLLPDNWENVKTKCEAVVRERKVAPLEALEALDRGAGGGLFSKN